MAMGAKEMVAIRAAKMAIPPTRGVTTRCAAWTLVRSASRPASLRMLLERRMIPPQTAAERAKFGQKDVSVRATGNHITRSNVAAGCAKVLTP